MPARVTLTVIQGPLRGKTFVFDERTTCVIGRSKDCFLRLPDDDDHAAVSRHHCLLDVNPPEARVRDFGSLNGTYVNGVKIGQRCLAAEGGEAVAAFAELDLNDGDEVRVGGTAFRVALWRPQYCARCSAEVTADASTALEVASGGFLCGQCAPKGVTRSTEPRQLPLCAQCGGNVSAEAADVRNGDYLCAACRSDLPQVARNLLEQVAGEYELIRELGRGGMGAVFLVRHAPTGQESALKLMLPQVAAEERARRMFLREVESTQSLQHPHVIRLYDSGYHDGTFYFTMEYCTGGSAQQLALARGSSLPVAEAATILLQALDGLAYAHGRGLVHRDFKPGNLFLSAGAGGWVAKVGDYGLAKAFDAAGLSGLTWTGAKAGTAAFLPRQQVIDYKYARPEVDVWAAAASLYRLLTGHTPRDFPPGRDPWQVVLHSDPVPIRQRNPAIPVRLAEVIDHALVDRPAIAFQTAAELRAALAAAL